MIWPKSRSISSRAQYAIMPKKNSHPRLVIYLFCNPTHKTETGTPNRWGTTNSEPPEPIIPMGQSEILSSSQIIFITLFSAGAVSFTFCPFIGYMN
jgi:hypothetical protein